MTQPLRFRTVRIASLHGLLLLAVVGCGPEKTVEVSGTVRYKDRPLPVGRIFFFGPKGHPASGDVAEGKFKVAGVPVGDEIKVVVETTSLLNEIREFEIQQEEANAEEKPGVATLPKEEREKRKADPELVKAMKELKRQLRLTPIPPHYEHPKQTPLVYKVSENGQVIDITLEVPD